MINSLIYVQIFWLPINDPVITLTRISYIKQSIIRNGMIEEQTGD